MPRDSALMRAWHGNDKIEWTPTVEILAQIGNTLAWANWQRGGGKGRKPRPVRRPDSKPTKIGITRRPQAQVKALLASYSHTEG